MTYKIERSITIAASPEAVWSIIQDPTRRTEWDARVIACRQTSDGEVQLGTSFEMVYNLFGLRIPMAMEYIAWHPFTQSAVSATSNGFSKESLAGTWLFTREPDGKTTWTTKINLRSEGGPFSRLLEWVYGRYTDHLTVLSQKCLKKLVEVESAQRSSRAQ